MKQSEKDLLLALLIDRYTAPTAPTEPKKARAYKRRSNGKPHQWTSDEVKLVLTEYLAGRGLTLAMDELGLRQSQVENLIYSVIAKRNRFTFEQFGLVFP